ncbi:MAG: rod shape-determining protein MreC [Myxococcales bacterium]|nr:MAG: rod shape-determining protein MreC [Myxococcales bacterium]
MSTLQRFRDAAFSIILLLIPFLFLNSHLKKPDHLNSVDRFVIQISAPVQYVSGALASLVSDGVEYYVWLVDVAKENHRLRSSNSRLKLERQQWLHDARENKRLRTMLDFRERSHLELIGAEVISKDANAFFRVLRMRLDRGESDLLRPGMAIISPQGLVGQIEKTVSDYSDVMMTVDRRSAVDVVIDRTGARGVLRGTGDTEKYLCRIQYLDQANDVRPGDLVVTSGFGKRFPSSIPIGRIKKITKKSFGLHQEALVKPIVDFSTLDEVFVVLNTPPGGSLAEEK